MNESNCDRGLRAKRQLSVEVWHTGWGHSMFVVVSVSLCGILFVCAHYRDENGGKKHLNWQIYGRETYNCDLKAEQLALTTWKSPKVTLLEQCMVVVNTIAAMLLLSQWRVQWEYLEVPQILPCSNTCKLKWNTAEVTRPAKTLWPEGILHWQPNEVLGSEQTLGLVSATL